MIGKGTKEYSIIILNWERFNPRSDVKNPSWLRLQHNLFEDWKFYDFSHSEIVFWIYLLCEASRRNQGGMVTVNIEHAHRVSRLDATVCNSAIEKLQRNKVVEVRTLRGRYAHGTSTCTTRRYDTERDVTKRDETNETNEKKESTSPSETAEPLVELTRKSKPNEIVALFCKEYKRRYGTSYKIQPKEVAALKRLRELLGADNYEGVVAAYVDMPDQWFLTKRHDVITLESNLAKVTQFVQSGRRMITQTEIKQIDQRQANANVWDKLIEEKQKEESRDSN
jgi:hypothetical protein